MKDFPILASSLHQEALSLPFAIDTTWAATHQVVAVLTGGTEQLFQQLVHEGKVHLTEPIFLMVSNHSNSLAAGLEILSWIQQNGGTGRVITSTEDIAQDMSYSPSSPFQPTRFSGSPRLGVIGKPSDWLIASQVDYDAIREQLGIEVVDIPIEEVRRIGEVDPGVEGAEAIYQRLLEIVHEYHLDGLTLRCFDLLSSVKNTGCMALSHLNDMGIPAACEGDIPLLLTMMLAKQRWGATGFQVNPAEIHRDGRILFAHCTVPLKMTTSHSVDTHFESGIGIGIHGELPTGRYWLMKLSSDLHTLLCEPVTLTANQHKDNLCRTQVWVQGTPELAQRLLTQPIANHHLLVPMTYTERHTVSGTETAARMGSGLLPVFATPSVVALMEHTACALIASIPAGQEGAPTEGTTTVGTQMCIDHMKACLPGIVVESTARLTKVEGREYRFHIEVKDNHGATLASAEHTRFMVNAERFMNKLK